MEKSEIKTCFWKHLKEIQGEKKARQEIEEQFEADCKQWAKDMVEKFEFLESYNITISNKDGLLRFYYKDRPPETKKGFGCIKFEKKDSVACPIILRYCANDKLNTKDLWKDYVIMAYTTHPELEDMYEGKLMSIEEFLIEVIKHFKIA